jgi:hypothetical protein
MKLDEFPTSSNLQQCPCCDYYSLANRGYSLVCPVCFWEDDCDDPNNPDWRAKSDLNRDFSLLNARSNFKKYGAWLAEFSSVVISSHERITLKYEQRDV